MDATHLERGVQCDDTTSPMTPEERVRAAPAIRAQWDKDLERLDLVRWRASLSVELANRDDVYLLSLLIRAFRALERAIVANTVPCEGGRRIDAIYADLEICRRFYMASHLSGIAFYNLVARPPDALDPEDLVTTWSTPVGKGGIHQQLAAGLHASIDAARWPGTFPDGALNRYPARRFVFGEVISLKQIRALRSARRKLKLYLQHRKREGSASPSVEPSPAATPGAVKAADGPRKRRRRRPCMEVGWIALADVAEPSGLRPGTVKAFYDRLKDKDRMLDESMNMRVVRIAAINPIIRSLNGKEITDPTVESGGSRGRNPGRKPSKRPTGR